VATWSYRDMANSNTSEVKKNFTADIIANFECKPDVNQTIYKDAKTPSLGLRVTSTGTKSYIFESKLNGKNIRITIGDIRTYSLDGKDKDTSARAIATSLKAMTDKGIDPRQVRADNEAAKVAKNQAKIDAQTEQANKQTREALTVSQAWEAYYKERSTSKVDGKPEWGDRHKEHLAHFVQAGGEKRKRGKRSDQSETTRQGILYPLMSKRLIDLDAKAIGAWLDKELPQAPTSTSKAFSVLRAFLTWCSKHEEYSHAVHANACQTDAIKNKVPTPKVKENDSLRRAQIKPWFDAVKGIRNPVISAYLQSLLLTGARRNELATLRWQDVDFQWKSLTIRDKVEGERTIPLTPYVEFLISPLARRNEYVFSSPTAKSGRLEEPRNPHKKMLDNAALPPLSLHGLRRSFGTLAEWVEVPAGVVAQIMGHKPSAIAEKHYIQRELDLLHLWHERIESWILKEAGIKFKPVKAGLQVVASA
jgi:integrase